MGTCRSARQASWEEVAAVNESPLLTLGNLVLRWHSDLGIPRNGALLFSRPCRPEVNVSMQLLGRTIAAPFGPLQGPMRRSVLFLTGNNVSCCCSTQRARSPDPPVPCVLNWYRSWPLKSFMAQRSDASMPETGRRPVSRMHRHEPQSLALRAAAGLSTGVECLKTPWGIDDEEPRRAAPAQLAPAGTRPIHPRPGGRRAFGHDCSALVTRVGEALDHGEDYKEQLQANRVQPLSPPSPEPLAVASSAHPKRATIGHQPLLAVAQPKPSAARRPPPFAVDSSYDARPSSAREPRHLPVSHGPRSTPRPEPDATKHTILEATRKLKEAGVSTRDSPVRHHRLGS